MLLDFLGDPDLFETPEMRALAAIPMGAHRA
jgi:hypothetical protein